MLEDKVSKLKDEGRSEEEIYLILLSEGYKVREIADAFEKGETLMDKSKQYDKVTSWSLYFGFALIALGAIFFVGSNWKFFSPAQKVLILISALFFSEAAGYYLLKSGKLTGLGKGLILLGLGLFGANIFLLAQIFNLPASWSEGSQLWLMGALAVAFAVGCDVVYKFLILLALFVASVLGLEVITNIPNLNFSLLSLLLHAFLAVFSLVFVTELKGSHE